jgi:hypothetical protein
MQIHQHRWKRSLSALALVSLVASVMVGHVTPLQVARAAQGTTGQPWTGAAGIRQTTTEIMSRERQQPAPQAQPAHRPRFRVDRTHLRQDPLALDVAQWPAAPTSRAPTVAGPHTPQMLGTSFTGATLNGTNPTSAFPPDSMGAVGPTQFVVMVNGRIVTFDKTTGVADGVINATTNSFFSSVRNGVGTSDPRVRYDRLSDRWFMTIINISTPNRILIAVSDSASSGIISGSTAWTFFFIPISTISPPISSTCLADYPTLGIDANALYIGTNNYCGSPTQTFDSTDGYVIRKSSILGAGTIVATVFRGLVDTATSAGPFTPQGVDDFDASATEGFFIGVNNTTFGTLMIRRISNPGGTPTISGNISVAVPTTAFPLTVPHLGNTGGTNGNLDAVDDRLFAAMIRNGRLWTAHNIRVTNAGVGSSSGTRNAARWYEIQNLTVTPILVQSGTVFDSAAANPRFYWIPSIMISGQGHVAMGFSTAGANERPNAATVGRLVTDALGTMQTPLLYTDSNTAYNPPGDDGSQFGARRWGDYSYTSLDPSDDMTMWTIQEFCNATNSYGVSAVKLIAPPPATPASANPPSVVAGQASVEVTITGTSAAGSGFFDPGAGFAKRIAATVGNGVTVNSITYVNSTTVEINISTVGATPGAKDVTITNPDGQSQTGVGILTVTAAPTPPMITTQPSSQTIVNGQVVTLTVVATSTLPLSYQWYQGDSGNTANPIGGATGNSYTTLPLSSTTQYWVRVSNTTGSVDSTTAIVTVTTGYKIFVPIAIRQE